MARGSADDVLEGIPESTGLLGVQLHDQATTALERDAHHDAASFLGDLQRTVACPRLHRRHPRTFLLSCDRRPPRGLSVSRRSHYPLCGGDAAHRWRGSRATDWQTPAMEARSALFDVYGDHLRARGSQAPVAAVVRMLDPVGITAPAVRTAISRMVMQGWLEPVQLSSGRGYRTTERANRRLDETGDRVYRRRLPTWDGRWHVAFVDAPAGRA